MKKYLYTIALFLPLLLTSCSSDKLFGAAESSGGLFLHGFWDGAFWFFIWIWSLFDSSVHVWNGGHSNWYLISFMLMATSMARSSSSSD